MNIFMDAERIVTGSRQADYGHPADNHRRTKKFWQAYLFAKHGVEVDLDEDDVCWMNALQKIARECNAKKRDNLVDVVGYVRNIEMMQ